MGCTPSFTVKKEVDVLSKPSQEEFLAKYAIGEVIGSGSFGQVRRAVNRATQEVVAVKVLYARKETQKESLRTFRLVEREIESWQKVGGHPHIVDLLESFTGSVTFIVMECCQCSIFQRKMKSDKVLLKDLFLQMLRSIARCHERRIVHHDVKPDNFLCAAPGPLIVKLCDFGLARPLPKSGVFENLRVGTPPYMSPEMMKNEGHTEKTDVWSLGVTAYLLAFGHFPYGHNARHSDEMRAAIIDGRPPVFRRGDVDENGALVPASGRRLPNLNLVQFVQAVMARAQNERPTAEQALAHELFKEEKAPAEETTPPPRLHAHTLKQAETKAARFADLGDPTVQRELDDLLHKLQPELKRSFSLPAGGSCHNTSDTGASMTGTLSSSRSDVSMSLSRGSTAPVGFGSGISGCSSERSEANRNLTKLAETSTYKSFSDAGSDSRPSTWGSSKLRKLAHDMVTDQPSEKSQSPERIRMSL
mmetsp:Transcript_19054/g.34479  ORF Transcript_19054/g.34479 Transcript_19054/m.34479 type:complete len:475 (-) Transcript_19054:35-1459(-)